MESLVIVKNDGVALFFSTVTDLIIHPGGDSVLVIYANGDRQHLLLSDIYSITATDYKEDSDE